MTIYTRMILELHLTTNNELLEIAILVYNEKW